MSSNAYIAFRMTDLDVHIFQIFIHLVLISSPVSLAITHGDHFLGMRVTAAMQIIGLVLCV